MARTKVRLTLAASPEPPQLMAGAFPGMECVPEEVVAVNGYDASVPAAQVGGYATITPANGANTLTAAQSWAEYLLCKATASGAVTVTSLQPLSVHARQLVRNETSQTITFKWAGDAVRLAIATLTSVDVRCDGVIALAGHIGT